jgi:hypothetical protein
MPVFEDLLPSPHNNIVLDLLFELTLWHGLTKLHLHTEHMLDLFQALTKSLAAMMCRFLKVTCKYYNTQELPKEMAAHGQCTATLAAKGSSCTGRAKNTGARKRKKLNLATYKYHMLVDYLETIRRFGTMDNYNMQVVSFLFLIHFNSLKSP